MGAVANVQGIVIVNRSLYWTSDIVARCYTRVWVAIIIATDSSVISIGHACLFTTYSYILVLISVIVI